MSMEEPFALTRGIEDHSQAYFWTPSWQEGEREAEEDLRAGRVCMFENVDDLIRELTGEEAK
ncbi:MAG: hypothetical protein WHS45_12210 [Anaerolinea sp.]